MVLIAEPGQKWKLYAWPYSLHLLLSGMLALSWCLWSLRRRLIQSLQITAHNPPSCRPQSSACDGTWETHSGHSLFSCLEFDFIF